MHYITVVFTRCTAAVLVHHDQEPRRGISRVQRGGGAYNLVQQRVLQFFYFTPSYPPATHCSFSLTPNYRQSQSPNKQASTKRRMKITPFPLRGGCEIHEGNMDERMMGDAADASADTIDE